MKTVILVGDGMGDYPIASLGGKTPLQSANLHAIRRIAAAGETRLVSTVPAGIQPGSDVANLSLLGYNPAENYSGRAPIEAAGAGIALRPDEVAFRCNLVTIRDGRMADYSADHISTPEAHALINTLQEKIGRDGLRFHPGVSYRHLLVWRDGPTALKTQPPHDIADQLAAPHLPAGARQAEVQALMEASLPLFAEHPVNQARRRAGKGPATQIWLWGQGRALTLKPYRELYGLTGGVISAVDLIRGLGVLAGLRAPKIPGATGFIDTNFAAKVQTAKEMLERDDFVFMHIEAPDECGHKGDLALKLKAMELFDQQVVAPVWEYLETLKQPYQLVICTDHRTPVQIRGHTPEPVPMTCLRGPVGPCTEEKPFDEFVENGQPSVMAYDWIRELLAGSLAGNS